MGTGDLLLLARAQFGLNIAFQILFPTITIGLAWLLVYFRAQYAYTGAQAWLDTYQLRVKMFALSFAMGVVSGIVMSFQFGTNWPGYMLKVGNIAGPLLAYEVLTAFFLEATFLAVMRFGMNRVPGWVHLISTALVAAGTSLSAFWILALNSWMQTPAGHGYIDNQLVAQDWIERNFQPFVSLPPCAHAARFRPHHGISDGRALGVAFDQSTSRCGRAQCIVCSSASIGTVL